MSIRGAGGESAAAAGYCAGVRGAAAQRGAGATGGARLGHLFSLLLRIHFVTILHLSSVLLRIHFVVLFKGYRMGFESFKSAKYNQNARTASNDKASNEEFETAILLRPPTSSIFIGF